MKKPFLNIAKTSTRKIVIHQILDSNSVFQKLQNNDLIFFDDCLYSQYLFLMKFNTELKNKEIYCVLGFSTKIYRNDNITPIANAICSDCHDKFHNGNNEILSAYMSLNEIKDLLLEDNIYLACHGAKHLQLEKLSVNKYIQTKLFNNDLNVAIQDLNNFNLHTNIFIYPYAYDNFYKAENLLKNNNFYHIFAGKNSQRIEI